MADTGTGLPMLGDLNYAHTDIAHSFTPTFTINIFIGIMPGTYFHLTSML